MTDRLAELSEIGVSIWLDDLSRERLTSGSLQKLVDESHVVGVTTNPSIFQKSISAGVGYSDELKTLAHDSVSTDAAVRVMTTNDVRAACDVLRGVYDATGGKDGRVSIEVDPRLAHVTDETIEQALTLARLVDRPNVMIKIPATEESLPAVTKVIAAGISVNVTLIFSVDQYRQVADAYMAGLEEARRLGLDLSNIHSVASFFVSRVDTLVDQLLDAIGTSEATELRAKAGCANARLAYEEFLRLLQTPTWKELAAAGANVQRPLWASTGVKDPSLPGAFYVQELAAPDTVNTMPEGTLDATRDSAELRGDAITPNITAAHETFAALEAVGVDMRAVTAQLLDEGVEKFEIAWNELLGVVEQALQS